MSAESEGAAQEANVRWVAATAELDSRNATEGKGALSRGAATEPCRVLFIEAASGSYGGGSFESLYLYLCVANRNKVTPVVVFHNRNRYGELIEQLGIRTFYVRDSLYTEESPKSSRTLAKVGRLLGRQMASVSDRAHLRVSALVHRKARKRINEVISEERIDVIHLNNDIVNNHVGLLVAEDNHLPCIAHLRATTSAGRLTAGESVYANRVVTKYLANSAFTKEAWCSRGLAAEKVDVLFNAVPGELPDAIDIAALLPEVNDDVVICCVARLVAWKGHETLIKAFKRYRDLGHKGVCVFVGDGPYRPVLEHAVREAGLDEHVRFLGEDPRARAIIQASDILVLPSVSEPFGRVLIEAMQVGTPVVASNSGGIPEIVHHEQTGLLFPPGDHVALANELTRMMSERLLRERCIDNGRRRAEAVFSVAAYARQLETIYQAVCGELGPA